MEKIRSKVISERLCLGYYKEDKGFFINLIIESYFITEMGDPVCWRIQRSMAKREIESYNFDLFKENQLRSILSLRKVINRELRG